MISNFTKEDWIVFIVIYVVTMAILAGLEYFYREKRQYALVVNDEFKMYASKEKCEAYFNELLFTSYKSLIVVSKIRVIYIRYDTPEFKKELDDFIQKKTSESPNNIKTHNYKK